jgi:hypothetical protein
MAGRTKSILIGLGSGVVVAALLAIPPAKSSGTPSEPSIGPSCSPVTFQYCDSSANDRQCARPLDKRVGPWMCPVESNRHGRPQP